MHSDLPIPSSRSVTFGRRLAAVAALAFVLRLGAILGLPTQPVSDYWSYLARAENLVRRGEYAPFPGRLDANFPPAYPLAITPPIALGVDPVLGAKLINLALGTLAVLLFGAAAHALFGPAAGLAAATLAALHPRLILLTVLLASENLFLPLLLACLLTASRWIAAEGGGRWAFLLGAFLGLATLTRSVAYALWLPFAFAAWMRGMPRRRLFQDVLIILAVTHLGLLPWMVRNGVQVGVWTPLNTLGGINLFIGNHPGATGKFFSEWKAALEAVDPGASQAPLAERHRRAARAAQAWILDHPAAAASLYARKLFYLFTDGNGTLVHFSVTGHDPNLPPGGADVLPPQHPFRRHPQPVRLLLDSAALTFLGLALAGVVLTVLAARQGDPTAARAAVLPLATALYFLLVTAVYLVEARYRWPAEDVLVLLAALAVVRLGQLLTKGSLRRIPSAPPPAGPTPGH